MASVDFANSAHDLFNAALETLRLVGVVTKSNGSVMTARARIKRGVGVSWEPVFLEISVIGLSDRTRLHVVAQLRQDGSIHELSDTAIDVFIGSLGRRKDLTQLA